MKPALIRLVFLKKIHFGLLLFYFLNAVSQEKELARANQKYNNYAFSEAIYIYEKVAEDGYESAELFKKLGNSYYFIADMKNAEKWYSKLFRVNNSIETEYYFRYSHALKSIGDYENADSMMRKFKELTENNDSRGNLFNNSLDYLELIKKQSAKFKISTLEINSSTSDFSPSLYKNNFVFTSARDTGVIARRKSKWNDKYFLDLYIGDLIENDEISNIRKLSKHINKKFHESSAVFTPDGKYVYFTRNNYINGNKKNDEEGVTRLKILRGKLDQNGYWSNIIELPFNNDNYSTAHPALNSDGTKLYFSSDMPSSVGLSDIYVVEIKADDTFGVPENLGAEINTEGRETFPFISDNNYLFFSSNGRPGLGGLDVYVTDLNSSIKNKEILNLGEPINSNDDDFSFIIKDSIAKGYFASNREGGKGSDDIYSFIQTEDLFSKCQRLIVGSIIDGKTSIPLSNVQVTLIDNNMSQETVVSNEDGFYKLFVDCKTDLHIKASKETYLTEEVAINTSSDTLNIKLYKNNISIIPGDNLTKTLHLNSIYFDLDDSSIKKEAEVELAKVVEIMKKYPELKIDIRSHTDSRASNAYNLKLSDRRAKSTMNYLIKQGIESSRLTGTGYGEKELINECKNGIKCSESNHKVNRRSEFIIK